VEVAAGETLAPTLAVAVAGVGVIGTVACGTGETAGEEVWPDRLKASAIEQRQVRNVVFIGILLE
jgi:hypothetical protein